jgi:ribosomal protein S4
MYGKNIKNSAYNNHKGKYIFNDNFGSALCKLELRLNVLILRLCFVQKLLQANSLIREQKIKINGISKHKNYEVCIGDLISYSNFHSQNPLYVTRMNRFH